MAEETAGAPVPAEGATASALPTTGRVLLAFPTLLFGVGIVVTYLAVWPVGLRSGILGALIVGAAELQVRGILVADRLAVFVGSAALLVLAYFFMGNLHPILLGAGIYGLGAAALLWLFAAHPRPPQSE